MVTLGCNIQRLVEGMTEESGPSTIKRQWKGSKSKIASFPCPNQTLQTTFIPLIFERYVLHQLNNSRLNITTNLTSRIYSVHSTAFLSLLLSICDPHQELQLQVESPN